MQRRFVVAALSLVVVALLVFTIPVGISLTGVLRNNLRDAIVREARTMAFLVTQESSPAVLGAVTAEFKARSGGRVELVDDVGRPMLGLPAGDLDGPDLRAARRGLETVTWRSGPATRGSALVVTVPATRPDGRYVGAVRLTYPTRGIDDQVRGIWLFRLAVGLVTLALTAVLAVAIARSLNRPLRELESVATRFGRGDLGVRASETGPPETRRVAHAINESALRLERLLSAQRAFVADASHQLRSPLTALRLSLDNVQDATDDPQTRDALDLAIAEVVRMSRLTDALLALARAQGDATTREPLDVSEIVATRAEAWRAAADDRGVRLVTRPAPGACALLGPGHLDQVLDNLVANALDVSEAGSTLTLEVALVEPSGAEGRQVEVSVVDQGPGLAPALRERAFDRFWHNRPGGTGLGLSIVRQLVEDNQGSARLEDAAGGGLAVRVRFPGLAATDDVAAAARR